MNNIVVFPKLRRIFVTSVFRYGEDGAIRSSDPCLNDISRNYAIVKKSFIGEVCHEKCDCYQCKEQNFLDLKEQCLIVSMDCPFYVEAVMNDIRGVDEN